MWPANSEAQTSLQIPLQFDFINPGAKSLSLAGAFAGLADDATASFANPAGLMQLVAPELSIELRGTRTTSPFLQRGRLSGDVTNEKTDTIPGRGVRGEHRNQRRHRVLFGGVSPSVFQVGRRRVPA